MHNVNMWSICVATIITYILSSIFKSALDEYDMTNHFITRKSTDTAYIHYESGDKRLFFILANIQTFRSQFQTIPIKDFTT